MEFIHMDNFKKDMFDCIINDFIHMDNFKKGYV